MSSCVRLVWLSIGHHCQPSLQGAANVFFILIFRLVFVDLCVVVYEATRAWRPVACMFAQLEGKPKPPELQSSSRPSPKAPSSPCSRAQTPREAPLSLSRAHFTGNLSASLTFSAENLSLLGSETLLTPLSRPPPARH